MKKIIGIVFCILLITTVFPLHGFAENNQIPITNNKLEKKTESITVTLKSTPYQIITTNGDKSEINMDGFGSILIPGNPKLPTKIFNIGIPPGGEVVSINLISEIHETIPGNHLIIPSPPLSNGIETNEHEENKEIYSSINPYPAKIFEYVGMGQLRKYSFAQIRFSPMSYTPKTEKLILYREITIEIEYIVTKKISNGLLADTVMDKLASEIIVNFESIHPLYSITSQDQPSETYDYVIITTSSLASSTNFLKNWKELIGYSVKVVNKSWIYSNYGGSDTQEKIRNFLIDKYAVWGIEHVLIVGSHSNIPMRYCYPNKNNHNENGKTPTDYYYADLTGDWDSDDDNYYGERGDDSPDFNAEVWVGRIPVDTLSTVEDICQKTIDFEQVNFGWKNKVLMCGPIANFENEDSSGWPETDDATLMEELWNDIYQPNGHSRTTMYEKAGLSPSSYSCDYPLSHSNVLSYWPNGYGIVNLGGHGNEISVARKWWQYDDGDEVPESHEMSWEEYVSSSDTVDLNDDKPSIVFSCGCLNAYPENSNNLGTSLLKNGSVAYVGSTRLSYYTVGWQNENYGGNAAIEYYYFKYLVDQNQTCGSALYTSKQYYRNNLDWGNWESFQNLYDFCLYGDPSLSLKVYTGFSPPDAPDKPSGPTTGIPGEEYSFSTKTSDPDGHQVYYKWSWGDGSYSEWIGPFDSDITVEASYKWDTGGEYAIKVKARDIIGSESSWSNPLNIAIENSPPSVPIVTGETNGNIDVSYTYSATSTDPDGDRVSYWFDWGDDTTYGWVGPYESGTTLTATHVWNTQGKYTIKVKAKDIYDAESDWGTLEITMPSFRSKYDSSLFYRIFQRFQTSLPILRFL